MAHFLLATIFIFCYTPFDNRVRSATVGFALHSERHRRLVGAYTLTVRLFCLPDCDTLYNGEKSNIRECSRAGGAVHSAQARLALNRYLDAVTATSNINASAASSYSTSVGSSTQKRMMDEAQANEDEALGKFKDSLELGGQTLPGVGGGTVWDLSQIGVC